MQIERIHFDTIDSTNNWAKLHAHELASGKLTCISASEQTAGRGRFHRRWVSPKGENIYATLYFCIPLNTSYLNNLGQLIGIACVKVLEREGFAPQIKWPNDILLSGKKVSGILSETVVFKDRIGVVLGIGINLDTPDEVLEAIDQPAISLAQLSAKKYTREDILKPLVDQFLQDFSLLQKGGFKPFHAFYERVLAYKGESIQWTDGTKTVACICHSIDDTGAMIVQISSGELQKITSGEIKW